MSYIDAYIRSWRQSLPTKTHGALIDREIFSRLDPENPSKPGAIMQKVKRFSRAILEDCTATDLTVHESEQEIIYVVDGEGRIEDNRFTEKITKGSAMLIPPKVPHIIVNETHNPLELLIVTEDVSPEVVNKVGKKFLVRNYPARPTSVGGHWCHIVREHFKSEDGLVTLLSVLTVSIDGMTIGEPHPHGPGSDEVWYQLTGTSCLFIGKEIRKQHPGEAFMIPPDGKTPHSSINFTDEPMYWFYFRGGI